ncbi:MAG: hypothetical protein HKP04_01805, partial [Flavobacteriaceae bacterium]|nr:hypothetical protein [Flavobacteriaceae bacterium]
MRKMKMTGENGGRHIMTRMKMVLIGLALVTQGCVEESKPGEYKDVNREIALGDFENTLKEAGNSIEDLVISRPQLFYP